MKNENPYCEICRSKLGKDATAVMRLSKGGNASFLVLPILEETDAGMEKYV
jgi:hypothetical protein